MKHLISLTLIIFLAGCSSLKEKKVVKDGLAQDALTFYYTAEDYRLRGKYKEAINLYDRSGSIYISKLAYREYILTQLKKSLVFITLSEIRAAEITLMKARFWEEAFSINIDSEFKAVEAKLYLAQSKNDLAYKTLIELIGLHDKNLLLKTYYQSLAIETGVEGSNAFIREISVSFNDLYQDYLEDGTESPDALIYIGKTLINQGSSSTADLVKKMEHIGRELEIPALSIFILSHYKMHAEESDKKFFEYLINEVKRKEKAAILF